MNLNDVCNHRRLSADRATASYREMCGRRLAAHLRDGAAGEDEAGPDVFGLQPRVSCEDGLRGVTRTQHPEDVLHGEPASANDRLAAEDLRVAGDASEKFGLVHAPNVAEAARQSQRAVS